MINKRGVELAIDYQLWSLIGTWVSGLAMVASVIVSLYLATRSRKVKVVMSYHPQSFTIGMSSAESFFSITVSNKGEMPITIVDCGIFNPNKTILSFLPSLRYSDLPQLVGPESSINILIPSKTIVEVGDKNMIPNRSSKLVFYVRSAVGEYYKIQTRESADEIIKMSIRQHNLFKTMNK